MRSWFDAVLGIVLLVATGWACGVLAILWAADLDGEGSAGVAGFSALLLALAIACGVVAGVVRRAWRPVWVVLVVGALAAALPWLGTL